MFFLTKITVNGIQGIFGDGSFIISDRYIDVPVYFVINLIYLFRVFQERNYLMLKTKFLRMQS